VPGCAMRFVRFGSAVAVAVAGAAVTAIPATAEVPGMHNVTYSVFTEQPFRGAEIYYPYLFSPNVEADLGPGQQWTLNVQLANPDEWAMVMVSSGMSKFPPNFHCVLAVDGVVVSQNSGAKGALCSLRHW
jgi:hypothetical protein